MRFTHVPSYLVLAAGLGLGLLSMGCGQDSVTAPLTPTSTLEPAGKPSGGGGVSGFEIDYMQSTIDKEHFIRQLALLCLSKQVDHPDLHAFADTAADNAGNNVAVLQSWLSSWYGIQKTPTLGGGAQRTLSDLSLLEGAAFESAFLNQMIKQDEVSVRDGQRCYSRARTTLLIAFGFNLQYARAQEIKQLKEWRCDWFAYCR